MIKNRSLICILVIGLFIFVVCIYLTKGTCIVPEEDINTDTSDDKIVVMENNFKLESEYISENSWEYLVTGELPNPCYNATVDAIVAESYPEQVTVTVTIEEPDPEVMCAQVIQEFSYEGTFFASDKADIKPVVN